MDGPNPLAGAEAWPAEPEQYATHGARRRDFFFLGGVGVASGRGTGKRGGGGPLSLRFFFFFWKLLPQFPLETAFFACYVYIYILYIYI